MIGISVYAGMEMNIDEIVDYIKKANKMGINLLFTSAHIPEVKENFGEDFKTILNLCSELDITTVVDISKEYMKKLDMSEYKIDYIRLDYGFTLEEAALMTKQCNFGISVNATTFNKEQIDKFITYGGDISDIIACHNFYPRKGTGISEELLIEKNKLFESYGIKTMAFIPSIFKRRGPVHEGLPTLEKHRDLNPIVSAQHLLKLGINFVVVGDSMASIKNLEGLSSIKKDITLLPIKLSENLTEVELNLLKHVHINRADPGEYAVRSQESRVIKEGKIFPCNNRFSRKKYSITLDNEMYKRYEGELQILKKDLPIDSRVNTVADGNEGAILIDLLKPEEKFKFYNEK